jgi:hypothetical protein
MKKFLANLTLMCFLVAATLAVMAALNWYCFRSDEYELEFSVKQKLIRDTPSPKVVFLGGSNVAFGLDSKTIADSIRMPVVNAGLHAGLGLRFIMDNNIHLLQRGDILVMMPEYDHFSYADSNLQTMGAILALATSDEPLRMNRTQYMNVLRGFGWYNIVGIVAGCKRMMASLIRGNKANRPFEYRQSGFNEVGDEVSHWTLESGVAVPEKVEKVEPRPIDSVFVTEFAAKVQSLERRGVKVMILPPAMQAVQFDADSVFIHRVTAALAKQGVPFHCAPELFTYPNSQIYHPPYHLTKSGVDVNTQRIIRQLKSAQAPK